MAYDVLGHQPMAFGEAMSADHAVMLFAGPNGWSEAGILSTTMMLNYAQPVMRIYDFGAVGVGIPAAQYFIIGRPQGQGNIGQIVGPKPVNYCFYMAFGNACGVRNNSFLVAVGAGCQSSGASEDGNFAFWIDHCLLTSFGFNVAAQDMLFSANLPFMFVSMSVPDTQGFICDILADLDNVQSSMLGLANRGASSNNNNSSSRVLSENNSTRAPVFLPA